MTTVSTICTIRGPCADMRIRIIESGVYELPTKYMPARLLLGNMRVTGCPFCGRDIPGPVIEDWPWDNLIPTRPACVPPSIDPAHWQDDPNG